jgi:excisionase family DNA binding protein
MTSGRAGIETVQTATARTSQQGTDQPSRKSRRRQPQTEPSGKQEAATPGHPKAPTSQADTLRTRRFRAWAAAYRLASSTPSAGVCGCPRPPPRAADCGTASPCGGRLGGGRRTLTFGLFDAGAERFRSHRMHSRLALDRGCVKAKTPGPFFFTERTLADYLAVSDRTIRNWIRRGELPSYKLGASRRIDPADVDDFLVRHRDEAT